MPCQLVKAAPHRDGPVPCTLPTLSHLTRLPMLVPTSPPKMSAPIDAVQVRDLFFRPARIAPSDFLRREVSARMHERLELVKITPLRVLDAGCGPGADLAQLHKDYP